ncbi:hypothetical protein FGF01_12610 [Aeromonas salmonicida subsp. achromogenes]|nr:hypothetical protein FGF01_12610 [Aeromonas salmonicida subsp. achromogenes]TMX11958.1 hypothetical protein FGE99_12285 [Aeromonas salmonicida subsp. achromogenes]TMX12540.1 hypothetical protein FGF02_11540 [Aeromonas salmonicida subsp. achromogenes]TMX19234.1 hypothetical protein FGF00_12640 [Aeromonas salmonicida subsp. achromogenes]
MPHSATKKRSLGKVETQGEGLLGAHQPAKTDRLNREPPSDGDGITAASLPAPDETPFPMMQTAPGSGGA